MDSHIFNKTSKRFEPKETKCSFCRTGAINSNMEDNCFYPVYAIQDRTNLLVYRNVKFSEVKIGIPRCKHCRKIHSNVKTASYLSLFIGIPLVFIVPIYFSMQFDLGTIGMIIFMALTFGAVYLAMVGIEQAILNANDIKSEKEGALLDPLIKNFLRNGWSINRPSA